MVGIQTYTTDDESTDLEKFLALYESFGIKLKVIKYKKGDGFCIILEKGIDPKMDGYTGFYSNVFFDDEGKFIEQGFWE